MSGNSGNDENTRASAQFIGDGAASLIAHFSRPGATWSEFGKTDSYLEHLSLGLQQLLHCVRVELIRRDVQEPIDFGT